MIKPYQSLLIKKNEPNRRTIETARTKKKRLNTLFDIRLDELDNSILGEKLSILPPSTPIY